MYILVSVFVTLLGYSILPDQTPNANDGAVQISKQLPGYTTSVLKIRKNLHVNSRTFLGRMFYGQESPYTIIPIDDYRIEGLRVFARPVGRAGEEAFDLISIVHPLFVGRTYSLDSLGSKWIQKNDEVWYVDLDEEIKVTTQEGLLAKFEEDNIEKRRYWLGTDKSGRDLLSRLLYGTRISLSIGVVSVCISMFLGVLLGAFAGFFGKKVDSVILWFMSVVWSIPGIMLVIAISLALQSRGVWVAFVAVGLTMWVDVARVVRGQIFSAREKLYVEAARAFGLSNLRIIFRHMLPNIGGPLIVIATANFAAAILLEAGLSFLGLSVQPPTPSWGIMIYEGYNSIGTSDSWHLFLFPGLAISFMVLSFNLLGNGLRDAFDPKTTLQ
ncbi:MAG: ABC transporter permease [Bacteroidota bacterium]